MFSGNRVIRLAKFEEIPITVRGMHTHSPLPRLPFSDRYRERIAFRTPCLYTLGKCPILPHVYTRTAKCSLTVSNTPHGFDAGGTRLGSKLERSRRYVDLATFFTTEFFTATGCIFGVALAFSQVAFVLAFVFDNAPAVCVLPVFVPVPVPVLGTWPCREYRRWWRWWYFRFNLFLLQQKRASSDSTTNQQPIHNLLLFQELYCE